MSNERPTLRKRGEAPPQSDAHFRHYRTGPPGYDVLVGGSVIGFVLRHIQIDTAAARGGRRWTIWSAHAPDGIDYDPYGGYETRRDAVAEVVRHAT